MSTVCKLDSSDICQNFNKCTKYCECKVGESLLLMLTSMPTVRTKIGAQVAEQSLKTGTDLEGFSYCGVTLDKNNVHANIAKQRGKFKPFEQPFKSFGNSTGKNVIESFVAVKFPEQSVNYGPGRVILDKYYEMISGRQLPLPVSNNDEITMKFKLDGKERQELGRVVQVSWKPDQDTGEIKQYILGESIASGEKVCQYYEPKDFFNSIYINKYRLGLKSTVVDTGLLGMTSAGYLKPLKIQDEAHTMYLDGHHLINSKPDGTKEIVGSYTQTGEFKERAFPSEQYTNTKAYKVAKSIIPFISKLRFFIIPHGMQEDHLVDAVKVLNELKKTKELAQELSK